MSESSTRETAPSRRIGRSVVALFAGLLVNVALSLLMDFMLQASGVLPHPGKGTMNDIQSAIAASYRTLFGVLGSYVVAWLAPRRPLEHALLGAGIGMMLATAGAVATWSRALGPHWYPITLIVLALPTGWVGGKLWMAQPR